MSDGRFNALNLAGRMPAWGRQEPSEPDQRTPGQHRAADVQRPWLKVTGVSRARISCGRRVACTPASPEPPATPCSVPIYLLTFTHMDDVFPVTEGASI